MKEVSEKIYVLEADKAWARARIDQLEREILELGPEFHIALNQSTETWHDNAPFDALRDKQALLVAEQQSLKAILFKAHVSVPNPKANLIGIGSKVTVQSGAKIHTYAIVGHWSPRVGEVEDGAMVVSCVSPLAAALLGAKVGQTVTLAHNKKELTIQAIA
ncbi:MAG: GreA/GreB family elongation factor [Candidatus Saccharimonadales bacterium]